MKKKIGVIACVIAAAALCLAVAALCLALKPAAPAQPETRDIQYVLYLGTNGKDSNEPVFPPEEARVRAEDILVQHFGGYTMQEANGGWDEAGTRYREYTLVIILSDTTLAQVHAAADDLIRVFDQNSVLIQANETTTEFYAGGN